MNGFILTKLSLTCHSFLVGYLWKILIIVTSFFKTILNTARCKSILIFQLRFKRNDGFATRQTGSLVRTHSFWRPGAFPGKHKTSRFISDWSSKIWRWNLYLPCGFQTIADRVPSRQIGHYWWVKFYSRFHTEEKPVVHFHRKEISWNHLFSNMLLSWNFCYKTWK